MISEGKKNILLVEDEATTAMREKKKLEGKGYIVHHVDTGEQAVQRVTNNGIQIDLVLMDLDLGEGIDGTQAADELLKQKDIPIIFLSSQTDPEIFNKTKKVTSYGYVIKDSEAFVLDNSIQMAFKLFEAYKQTKQINGKLKSTIENLRIHQSELETQNEELIENQTKLQELWMKYTKLYDMLPAGYFTLSHSGTILESNQTGAELLGVPRSELINQPFTSFIKKDDQDSYYMLRKKMYKTNIPQTCELWVKNNEGSYFPAYLKAVALNHSDSLQGSLLLLIENDVS